MLREVTLHADWCEMTMSMMREKQFEACERRLFAHPGVGLFAPEATEADAQALLAGSFDDVGGKSRHTLATLEGLRAAVMERLPRRRSISARARCSWWSACSSTTASCIWRLG